MEIVTPAASPVRDFDMNLYVSILAAQTGVAAKYLEMSAFDACKTKLEVNQKFFEEILPRLTDNVSVDLPDGIRSFITRLSTNGGLGTGVINRARSARDQRLDQVMSMQSSLFSCMNELREATEHYYKALKYDGSQEVEKSLCKILTKGDWTYKTVQGEWLVFETTRDVVVKYEDVEAAIDMEVNFGKAELRVRISPRFSVQVFFSHNFKVENYPHPHVSSDNEVCWGNAARTLTTAMDSFNLEPMFNALYLLLNTYNPESPFRSLAEFKRRKEIREASRASAGVGSTAEGVFAGMERHGLYSPDRLAHLANEAFNMTMAEVQQEAIRLSNMGRDYRLVGLAWVKDTIAATTPVLATRTVDGETEFLVAAFKLSTYVYVTYVAGRTNDLDMATRTAHPGNPWVMNPASESVPLHLARISNHLVEMQVIFPHGVNYADRETAAENLLGTDFDPMNMESAHYYYDEYGVQGWEEEYVVNDGGMPRDDDYEEYSEEDL